ncbi:MAG: histidine kinase [Holophaga sp.]
MHPILKSKARLGTYLLGWVPFGLLVVWMGYDHGWPLQDLACLFVPMTLSAAFLFLTSWYLCRAFPAPTFRIVSHGIAWIVAALVMGGVWTILLWLLAQLMTLIPGLGDLGKQVRAGWHFFFVMGTILYFMVLALHYLLTALEHSREAERTEQELRVLTRDAELKALRAQLNPHFLFNSLNSISALTTLDPKRAREMCVLLSDFLRKSLKLGERTTVKLAEELDLVRNYLAIEQIRFGDRLKVTMTVDPEVESVEIPTLLLQPLVENAIKHGIAQVMEGGTIGISAAVHGEFVEIHVDNPVDADAEPPQGLGLGLRQVKQRLQGRYGSRTFFDAKIREGRHEAVLTFPRLFQENQP